MDKDVETSPQIEPAEVDAEVEKMRALKTEAFQERDRYKQELRILKEQQAAQKESNALTAAKESGKAEEIELHYKTKLDEVQAQLESFHSRAAEEKVVANRRKIADAITPTGIPTALVEDLLFAAEARGDLKMSADVDQITVDAAKRVIKGRLPKGNPMVGMSADGTKQVLSIGEKIAKARNERMK